MTSKRAEPGSGEASVETAPAAPAPSINRLFKNATIYGVGQIAVSIVSFFTDPLLSRLLTLADFGLLSLTRTVTNFLGNFYRLGMDGAANRIYYDVELDKAAQRRAIGTINTFLLASTLVMSILQELLGPPAYRALFADVPYAPYGRFVAYGLLCSTLMVVAQSIWTAQERAKLVAVVRLITSVITTTITFGLLLTTRFGVKAVFAAQVVGATIMLVVHLWFAYRSFGFAWDTRVLRRALALGLPMVLHLTSHWALELADRFILDKLMNRDAVGLYSVAYGTTSALMMVNGSVNGAYVPQFNRAYRKPDQERFVAQAVTYFMLVVCAATFGFVLFAPTVIRGLYSSAFAPSSALAPILALAAPCQAVYLIYVNALFSANRTGAIPVLTLISGAVNVGLNLLWIPRYGLMGAAWATLAGYAALAILFRIGATRVERVPIERGRLARLFGLFAIIVAIAWGVDGRLPLWSELAVKLVIALAVPFAFLASGFLTPEERAIVRQRVRRVFARPDR